MKRLIILLVYLVLGALQIACSTSEDWYLLETSEYKIYFPEKPVEETRMIKTEFGELKYTAHISQIGDTSSYENTLFGILETEYPENAIPSGRKESLDSFFNRSIKTVVTQVHGKLVSEKTINYKTFPGREIFIDYGNGQLIIIMRIYLVNSKMYQLQAMTKPSNKPYVFANKFMDSFTLK